MNDIYDACSFYYACNMRFYAVALALHVHGDIAQIGCECMTWILNELNLEGCPSYLISKDCPVYCTIGE